MSFIIRDNERIRKFERRFEPLREKHPLMYRVLIKEGRTESGFYKVGARSAANLWLSQAIYLLILGIIGVPMLWGFIYMIFYLDV